MKHGEWLTIDGVELRPTVRGDEHDRSPLPTGKEEIMAVAVLRLTFGGKNWRRTGTCSASCDDRVETSATWKNEYGVEVEVRT
jgi:hypothetical protein